MVVIIKREYKIIANLTGYTISLLHLTKELLRGLLGPRRKYKSKVKTDIMGENKIVHAYPGSNAELLVGQGTRLAHK